MAPAQNSDRYERGLEILKRVGGAGHDAPLNTLRDLAPDLARFTVEFAYGDVMARPSLTLPTRQLCTIGALAALGNARSQLEYHINGALNVGCSPQQIIEVMILMTVYAGFPAALNGVSAAREVFRRRGVSASTATASDAGGARSATAKERHERGLKSLERVSAGAGAAVVESLKGIAPDLSRFILEFSYGDVISRSALDLKLKELVTVAALTALGTANPQLKVHVSASLNVGNSRAQIIEAIQQMAVYAGFPAALNGIAAAREAFSEHPA